MDENGTIKPFEFQLEPQWRRGMEIYSLGLGSLLSSTTIEEEVQVI
jgi:hypothetical protein